MYRVVHICVVIFLIVTLMPTANSCSDESNSTLDTELRGTTYNANPSNYLTYLNLLQPGDTLNLASGIYTDGLPITSLNGTEAEPITIIGPENDPRAVFQARNWDNTINIIDSSYIEIYNLELDGQDYSGIDAVKAKSESNWAHHIKLENLYIHNHDASQSTVGISTKCPVWNWTIRRNIINSAGTGLYLGDSDGSDPFVNGLIEGNLIIDTVGYNMQIKHQINRPSISGMPDNGITIIRHNVFSKLNNGSSGSSARPNLLAGHWPLSGPGMDDIYLIYGNFFYQNPHETLFQGEGNIAFYDNLLINDYGSAMTIQPHNDEPRRIRIFNNTVVSSGTGINVSGGNPSYQQKVIANASFAAIPISAIDQTDNVTDNYSNSVNYLVNPTGSLGQLDLYPLPGTLTGSIVDSSFYNMFLEWNHDFNSDLHDCTFRGAYAGEGQNPGWLPQLERKPLNSGTMVPSLSSWSAIAILLLMSMSLLILNVAPK